MPEPYPPPPKTAASERIQQFGTHETLLLVALGVGVIGYLTGFFNEMARVNVTGLAGAASLIAALLAGLRLAPRLTDSAQNASAALMNTTYFAAPLAVYAALAQLQALIGGGSIGMAVVLLVLTLLQAAALVVVLLGDLGVRTFSADAVKKKSEPTQTPPPPFAPPGQFQQGSGWNAPGKPVPGHFGQPPVGGAVPASGWSPNSGGQPAPNMGGQGNQPQPAPPQPAQAQPAQPQPGQPQPGQAQPGQAQPGQPQPGHVQEGQAGQQSGQPGGPQGTQQMPYPGN